jgi:hypothetical protein
LLLATFPAQNSAFRFDLTIKADPFVSAGYTLMFRAGHANLVHFGGGLTYWFHSRFGSRLEFRDHVHTGDGAAPHYWGFRMGLALR